MTLRSPLSTPIGGYSIKVPATQFLTVGATLRETTTLAASGGGAFTPDVGGTLRAQFAVESLTGAGAFSAAAPATH